MKFAKILKHLTVAAMLMVGASSAQAVMIQGNIGIAGTAQVTTPGDLIDATSVTLLSGFALNGTGDFAGVAPAILDLPGGSGTVTLDLTGGQVLPVDIWSVGGFTFSTETLAINAGNTNPNALTVSGNGTITGNGFDATDGFFVLTTQGGTGGNPGDYTFTFSAFTAVPESSTLALMGLGLIGLAAVRRRRA